METKNSLNSLVVAKHNDLIQAKMPKTTIDEQRIINMTLGYFDPLHPKLGFEFSIRDFSKVYGIDENNAYKQVKSALRSIASKGIVMLDDPRYERVVYPLSEHIYFKEEGRFYVEFNPKLLPLICALKSNYSKYFLENIAQVRSVYALRLYEYSSMILGKFDGDCIVSLDDFRFCLDLTNKYPRFGDLKDYVINPAINEINNKTDLFISYTPLRVGRSYKKIRFIVRKKQPDNRLKAIKDPVFNDVIADPFQADYWEKSNYSWRLICEKYGVDINLIFNALRNRKEKIETKGRQHYFSLTDKYLATVLIKNTDVPQGIKYIIDQIRERRS